MAVTAATLRVRYPEFTATAHPDAIVEDCIEEALLIHSYRERATMAVAAHFLALRSEETGKPDGGAGVVVSEGIGPQRVTYANQATDAKGKINRSFFATTPYGRSFLTLEGRGSRPAISAFVARG